MVSKSRLTIFALGFSALAILMPATTQAVQLVDVTFTVPVQIQNIHSGWSKVGVFCNGDNQTEGQREVHLRIPSDSNLQIGVIDVSNKSRTSINQTVTGTIQLPDTITRWACELKIQYQGQSAFPEVDRRILTEVKDTSVVSQSGQF